MCEHVVPRYQGQWQRRQQLHQVLQLHRAHSGLVQLQQHPPARYLHAEYQWQYWLCWQCVRVALLG